MLISKSTLKFYWWLFWNIKPERSFIRTVLHDFFDKKCAAYYNRVVRWEMQKRGLPPTRWQTLKFKLIYNPLECRFRYKSNKNVYPKDPC